MLDYLFETSWEVCNKVGGIYAVLSTKANTLQQLYKDKVIFIGPDLWKEGNESPYFTERKTLLSAWRRNANLPEGVSVRVGRWNVPGSPIAILVDYKGLYGMRDELYGQMWEHFSVDSLHGYGDYDESCMFAVASAMVIESIVNWANPMGNVIAHFDEWTTGMGLLHVKLTMPQITTVFTTHATSIGRSISGNGKPLYDYMSGYNGDQMAGELNMQSKHSLEKAAAHAADAFTTVSEVTARECEQLLERVPMVTPNAFEQGFVPKGTKFSQKRKSVRKRMLEVASTLTGTHYDDETMIVATSGRCEFRNKGIDVYLDALNVLGSKLQNEERKVVAFALVPAWVNEARKDLKEALEQGIVVAGNKTMTHTLHNHGCDCIENKINSLSLVPGGNVSVVYVPCYLTGDDGIFDMPYYDMLCGLDLAVFPSYYEPWGYTPLESMAFAVPTITTDLAGYGQWIIDNYGSTAEDSGAVVLHRGDSNYHETVHELANRMQEFFEFDKSQVTAIRKKAQATAQVASWSNFIEYYNQAYIKAVELNKNRNNK